MLPDYLYHYTTKESVLSILKNKTIRFRRLDALNDLIEGCCKKYAPMKKYVFISSWCADKRESIPMWSMYGQKGNISDEGVRIKVPSNIFTKDSNGNMKSELCLKKILGKWNVVNDVETKKIEIAEVTKHLLKNVDESSDLFSKKEVVGPVKVEYIPVDEYLEKYGSPSIVKKSNNYDSYSFYFEEIGHEKVDDWSYENEYRFWMTYPYVKEIRGELVFLEQDVSFTVRDYIDVYYNEKAIAEMEILLGPNFNSDKESQFREDLMALGFTKELQRSRLQVRLE